MGGAAGGAGGGAMGFSPAASAGSWTVSGKDSGGLEKFRISTSWLAAASASSATRQPANRVASVCPSEAVRQAVLVANPVQLYDF